jgi:peptidoglycan LD-endopeptidase LytH
VTPLLSPDRRRALRIFLAGAGSGLLAGAFIVSTLVWQYGNIIGSRAAAKTYDADAPSPIERWVDGLDDAGDGVIRMEPGARAVATSGEDSAVSIPPPSPTPTVGPPVSDALAGRDLLIPVDGVTSDQLVRSFSQARGSRVHEAIDILAPKHTAVKAVENGKIARLFSSKAGGITIYQFDPSEQFTYYYAHLDRYADGLAEGQTVQRGQVIGYVGVSGNAPKDTPHLHFAIFRLSAAKRWWEGTPIDPYDVLK